MNNRLLSTINSSISQQGNAKNNDVYYWCPVCKKPKHNKKLSIVLEPTSDKFGRWHCWVCETHKNVKGNSVESFLKFFKVEQSKINEVNDYITSLNINIKKHGSVYKEPTYCDLPKEFVSLNKYDDSPEYKIAKKYLSQRNITQSDIIKYNIGMCKYGSFANRIIIPSYDSYGQINYFSARSVFEDAPQKYTNPKNVKKTDIIFNEIFINWNEPIIFVEGIFDALATKFNAIPLLGKTISDTLRNKLIEHNVKKVYIALDLDAKANSLKYIEMLLKLNCNVYFVSLNKKDPAEIGSLEMFKLMKKAKQIKNKQDLIKLKMNIL